MTRRPAAPAVDEDLQCLLCGGVVEPFWHPELRETVAYELCPRCAQAFQKAADTVAARVVVELAHNFADAHCGHPDSVGEFPVPGAVCPLCRPAVPGQLALTEEDPAETEADTTEEDTVAARELGAVLDALRTGYWTEVETFWIADALHYLAATFRADELAAMRAELERRA